jgi:hypothetical protein
MEKSKTFGRGTVVASYYCTVVLSAPVRTQYSTWFHFHAALPKKEFGFVSLDGWKYGHLYLKISSTGKEARLVRSW